jgi:CP family cyanate transporter-like MFS transporter
VNHARFRSAALAAGVALIAINLRPAAAAIGPVLNRIQSDTGLSSGWAGALTTLPVLCFGLLAPLAPVLARRLGVRTALAGAMFVLLAGMLLRLIPGVGLLFLGTALAGAAIATGNVLLPVLVRRDFSHRTGTAMSLYTVSLIGFAALSAGVTVPVADALGGGWRPGLAVWAIPAAIAALAWLPALVRRDAPAAAVPDAAEVNHSARALLRRPLAWAVTLFFALQSGGFYAVLAWLPSIFRSHGASEGHAGLLLSLTMLVGLVTALIIPGLAGRSRDQRPLVVASCVLTVAGLLGILLAPMSAPYLWVVVLGLGQNAAFPLALMLIVNRAGNVATTEGLSTMAQSIGYVLSSLAPLAVGALHGISHSWTPALILLLALVAPQLVIGLAAARDRQLAPPSAPPPDDPRAPVLAGDAR